MKGTMGGGVYPYEGDHWGGGYTRMKGTMGGGGGYTRMKGTRGGGLPV